MVRSCPGSALPPGAMRDRPGRGRPLLTQRPDCPPSPWGAPSTPSAPQPRPPLDRPTGEPLPLLQAVVAAARMRAGSADGGGAGGLSAVSRAGCDRCLGAVSNPWRAGRGVSGRFHGASGEGGSEAPKPVLTSEPSMLDLCGRLRTCCAAEPRGATRPLRLSSVSRFSRVHPPPRFYTGFILPASVVSPPPTHTHAALHYPTCRTGASAEVRATLARE